MALPEDDPRIQIALRAQEHKVLFLGLNLALPAMLHPDVPLLHWTLQLMGTASAEDFPVILAGDATNAEKLSFSAREILTKLTKLRGEIVGHDLMSIAMLLGATRLGDILEQASLYRRDEPLLQFARPFRNAAAHGDRWEFRNGEPKYRAACRDLVLKGDMNGRRATWKTVTPKKYVEFLDDLSNHFVPGLVPPPNPPMSG